MSALRLLAIVAALGGSACVVAVQQPEWRPRGQLARVVLYVPSRDTKGNLIDDVLLGTLAHSLQEVGATVVLNPASPHHATLALTVDVGVCEQTVAQIAERECEPYLAQMNTLVRSFGTPPLSLYASLRSQGLSYAYVHAGVPWSDRRWRNPRTNESQTRPDDQGEPFAFGARLLASQMVRQEHVSSIRALPLHEGED